MTLCLLTAIVSLFFITASSQDAGSLRHCPVSYLVSASDVLSNVSALHHDPTSTTESLVQDVVSFDTIYCDQSLAADGNIFTLNFSEQVLVNRIRVSGLPFSFVSNFSLLIQENSTGSHNQFNKFLVDTSENVVFAIPNRTAHSLQFRINSAVAENNNQYCWHINVFGCRLTEVVSKGVGFIPDSMMSSSIQSASSSMTAMLSLTPTVTVLSCQNNLAATVVPVASLIVVLLLVITIFIAVLAMISYRKYVFTRRRISSKTRMKSVPEENGNFSANTLHREGIKSPDGEYASIPELGLTLNTMRRGNNEVILEMADINTDSNPTYESPELPPKNGHSRSNSCSTNGASRLKRALSYGFRRDPAVEDTKRTERESDLYI